MFIMKTPICEVCLKSDILCTACQEKINNNQINKSDVNVCRFLYGLSKKIKSLGDAEIRKIINSNNLLIVAGKGDAAKLVGKGGSVVKVLAKEFGKSIRIIEEDKELKSFVTSLITPAKINGINTVFTEGQEKLKIRIWETDKSKMPMSKEELATIIKDVFDADVKISVEN